MKLITTICALCLATCQDASQFISSKPLGVAVMVDGYKITVEHSPTKLETEGSGK